MSSIKLKKSSRPPPRLRTKTGCITCRDRRKKCDERKPICLACRRLKITCVYRDASEEPSASSSSASPTSASHITPESEPFNEVVSPYLSNTPRSHRPQGLRTQRDFNLFQYCAERYIHLLTSPDATAEFRDVSFLFATGFDQPFVMHAVLAPAALHAACAELIPKEDAMVYTQSALQGLRLATESVDFKAELKFSFLAASLFMGIFEVS